MRKFVKSLVWMCICISVCLWGDVSALLCFSKVCWGVCIRASSEREHIHSSIQTQSCSWLTGVSVSMSSALLWLHLDTHCHCESWEQAHTHTHICTQAHIWFISYVILNFSLVKNTCNKHLRKWFCNLLHLFSRSQWLMTIVVPLN